MICDLGLKCFISRLKLQKRLKFLFQNLPNVQILFCCWVTQSKSSKADWKYTQIFLSRSKSQNSIQARVRVNVIYDPCQFQTMVSLMMIWEWKCWVLGCILWKSGHDRTELQPDFLMFSTRNFRYFSFSYNESEVLCAYILTSERLFDYGNGKSSWSSLMILTNCLWENNWETYCPSFWLNFTKSLLW